MTPFTTLLNTFRNASATEREKGTYFEELILTYLRNEATYKDLYSDVWSYADWAKLQGLDTRDTKLACSSWCDTESAISSAASSKAPAQTLGSAHSKATTIG